MFIYAIFLLVATLKRKLAAHRQPVTLSVCLVTRHVEELIQTQIHGQEKADSPGSLPGRPSTTGVLSTTGGESGLVL